MKRTCAASLLIAFCAACSRSPAPTAPAPVAAARIDVLDYLIGDAALWPRRGDMSQHQVVDPIRREVCWPKHTNPRFFECWRWDEEYVYHVVDHAVDGNTGVSYAFVDGRWMPRYLDSRDAIWQLDVSTRIVWFDPDCRINSERSGPFRYHQRAWLETQRDAGGDLGVRDTLVLEYAPEDPAGGPTLPEHFYFGRSAGWYEWTRADTRIRFNRFSTFPVPVVRDIVCAF